MTSTAPPQTPGAMALAKVEEKALAPTAAEDITVRSIAAREDVERIETVITIPADYQYAIPVKGMKNPDGSWNNDVFKVLLTSDAYDYMNRVVGVTFDLPPTVPNREGEMRPNPILQKDYIRLRMVGVWYNPLGQLLSVTEDVEVDYNLVWMDARINAKSARVVITDGLPVFDAFGNPALTLNADDELKALKTLSQLRTFGVRYAQTVARVRILKQAIGIRSLPGNQVGSRQLKVVGYRDRMTPQERIEQASSTFETLYGGRVADLKPLTAGELAGVEGAADTDTALEHVDRDRIAAAVDQQPVQDDQPDEPGAEPGAEPVAVPFGTQDDLEYLDKTLGLAE